MSARGVVVLGGSGFLGRHIARAFATAGWRVLVVGRRSPPDLGLPFAALDLAARDVAEIAETLGAHRPAAVVNGIGANWNATSHQMHRSNTVAPLRLLAALARMPVRPRLVHLGSVLEYGPVPAGTVLDERSDEHPSGPAGRTKLAATRAIRHAVTTGGCEATVLRLPNVVGPGAPRASLPGAVAAELLHARDQGRPAVLAVGPLRDVRDFVDVRDIADAVVAAAGTPYREPVLNLGSGRAVSARTLVDLLVSVSGVPASVTHRPPATGAAERAQPRDAVAWTKVNAARARAVLGWQPRRSLRDSVRDLWLELDLGDRYARTLHRLELDR